MNLNNPYKPKKGRKKTIDYQQAQILYLQGLNMKQIALQLQCARTTISNALNTLNTPKRKRTPHKILNPNTGELITTQQLWQQKAIQLFTQQHIPCKQIARQLNKSYSRVRAIVQPKIRKPYNTRTCKQCNTTKILNAFPKCKSKPLGHHYTCKQCKQKKYQQSKSLH